MLVLARRAVNRATSDNPDPKPVLVVILWNKIFVGQRG